MNTFIRSWVIVPVTNDNGVHFGGVYGFLRSIKSAVDKFNPSEVVIAFDGPKAGLRRKELFPEYKGNRLREWTRGSVRAYDFLSEQEQKENFIMQLNRINDYINVLPVKSIRIPYVEADDVIAVYAQRLSENSDVIIYSSDADFKQLVNDKICAYNPISKILTTQKSFTRKHKLTPQNYIIMKSIMGDKSDNIPGIKGIGEKTLIKMFPELIEDNKITIDNILEKSLEVGFNKTRNNRKFTPGILTKFKLIAESADQLKLNYRIMQLENPEISNDAKKFVYDAVKLPPNRFDSLKFKMMLIQDKLEKTVKTYNTWSSSFSKLQTH